jgi:pimeloyl-ACP methyl ester carboxylesterase
MAEFNALRKNKQLLPLGKKIKCPVIAIHGDYDPHPYKGIFAPLSQVIENFEHILLKQCGHTPWVEKHAKNHFLEIIDKLHSL